MAEERILAVEGDQEFVECSACEGAEGGCDENDEWHDCIACNGEGGFWRERSCDLCKGARVVNAIEPNQPPVPCPLCERPASRTSSPLEPT